MILAWIAGALVLLVLAHQFFGSFLRARPRDLAKAVKLFAASFLAMAGMGLLAFGRIGLILALVGAVFLTVSRYRAATRAPDPLEPEPEEAAELRVDTAWLELRLDRRSGRMRGKVRLGRFAGRDLQSLAAAELLALKEEIARAEPASVPLVETWLDRVAPGWRGGGSGPVTSEGMTEALAFQTLGLSPPVGRAEIEAAYRRLMAKVHPDKGGSDHLAALVNAARDFLLSRY